MRDHIAILAVLTAFALSALVVPTLTPIATTDDWTYARSAQILLAEGRLTVFPVVVATAIVPIVWGALFGVVFGPELGVFRLSTVVMTLLGGLALYGICRDFGVSRARSALGVATFLFNPLVFVLAFTFMTDPHFVSLLIIAVWCFTRGLSPTAFDARFVVAGSAMAALAFLTRHQGALIVPAVVAFLIASRRLHFDRASLRLMVQLVTLPLLAIGGYFAWLISGENVGAMQGSFLREIEQGGWEGTWWLMRWLTLFTLLYLGFFILPLIGAVLPFDHHLAPGISPRGRLFAALWALAVIFGVGGLAQRGDLMPYLPQFVGPMGLGPPDLLGGRPLLLGREGQTVLTLVCLLATLVLGFIAARATAAPISVERSRAALLGSIGLGQLFGIFPPSYHFLGWSAGSVDRYLAPLAPIAIVLVLWALRGMPMALPAGWMLVALLALVSIAGTRDYLVFMNEVWSMADQALDAGVPLDRLDAGAGWDGYHLYETGMANQVAPRTEGGPWWIYMNAPATDSTYVVAGAPLAGYDILAERPYSSWLSRDEPRLFLLRRQGEGGPP